MLEKSINKNFAIRKYIAIERKCEGFKGDWHVREDTEEKYSAATSDIETAQNYLLFVRQTCILTLRCSLVKTV